MHKIAILGAGMAGFGAAHHLFNEGLQTVLYEKEGYYGGHTASFETDGFIFDDGPHISFTSNERLQKLFAEGINDAYERFFAHVNNYWKEYWIKHPAQCNLYGLPVDLVVDIISEFINIPHKSNDNISNYKEWLVARYGKTFAENFPMQYGSKFHTTTADNMSIDWIGPRLYQPDLKEVLYGALSPETEDVHYVTEFRYPTHGGFVSYLKQFLKITNLRLDHEVAMIDPANKKLRFTNYMEDGYDYLISSIPLPELIPRIKAAPSDVVEASQKLACTSCLTVNVGIDRKDISNAHWTYFYDDDFIFTRLSFPHLFSPKAVPKGAGSIQAEIYYSEKYKPLKLTPKECVDRTIDDLIKCGLLLKNDEILVAEYRTIAYANIIFDHDRAKALKKVHDYLANIGVFYCGRYGEWGYHWTDQSFLSGEKAAQKVLDRIDKQK